MTPRLDPDGAERVSGALREVAITAARVYEGPMSTMRRVVQSDAALMDGAGPASAPSTRVDDTERAQPISDNPPSAAERARRWKEENADALRAYAERIDQEGVFGDDLRAW